MPEDTEEDWAWLTTDVWGTPKSALELRRFVQGPEHEAVFRRQIKDCESHYRGGDKNALLGALFVCASCCRPMPSWVAKEICQVTEKFRNQQIMSWDDVFGKPFSGERRKGTLTRRKAKYVWFEVRRLHEEKNRTLDDSLFADVGNKFGFRATTARNLYYEHLDLIRSRVWETVNELLEKGRGLDESFDEVSKRIAAVSAPFARDLYHDYKRRMQNKK